MSRIRLQIQVLPWQDSNLPLQHTRQEAILPWTEPCSGGLTIQALCERIVLRFASIHRGKGTLNIKYLQDFYGGVLDTSLTVGEIFEDRARGGDIRNSIVKVARFPPPPGELENPIRFASIDPESSARPRKRPIPPSVPPVWGSLKDSFDSQPWESGHNTTDQRVNKRIKIETPSAPAGFNSDFPMPSSEVPEDRAYDSLQSFVVQRSPMVQIADSQRSPLRKQPNPYGTPTSLSVHSPYGRVPFKHNFVVIPDSPPCRGTSLINTAAFNTSDNGLCTSRSESVELDSIPNEGPVRDYGPASLTQTQVDSQTILAPIVSSSPALKPLGDGSDRLPDEPAGLITHVAPQGQKSSIEPMFTPAAEKSTLPKSSNRPTSLGNDLSQAGLRDMFDPVDTDNEYSYEPRNIKRLKSSQLALDNYARGLPEVVASVRPLDKLQSLPRPSSIKYEASAIAVENGLQPVLSGHKEKLNAASIVQDQQPLEIAINQSTDNANGTLEKPQNQVKNMLNENPGKLQPAGKGAKKTKLVKARERIKNTLTESKTIPAGQQVQDVVSGNQTPEITVTKSQIEARKQTEGSKGDSARAKEKGNPAKAAEMKRSAEERQTHDRIETKPKHKDERAEDKLFESKGSTALGEQKSNKDRSDSSRGASTRNSKPPVVNGKSRILESVETKSKVVDQNTRNSTDKAIANPRQSLEARSQDFKAFSSKRKELNSTTKSMTSAFPRSSMSNSQLANHPSSQGTPLEKPGNSDTQLKSAFRHTPSSLRPRVKFHDDSITVPDLQNPRDGATSNVKHQERDIDPSVNSLADGTAIRTLPAAKPSKNGSKKSKDASTIDNKQEKEMVQSKLKIEKNKMKGRIIDPPVPLKPASQEHIVISSDSVLSVSSYYSDEDPETRNAKAGPSKRRKSTVRVSSANKVTPIKVEPTSQTSNSTSIVNRPDLKRSSGETPEAVAMRLPAPKSIPIQSDIKKSSAPVTKSIIKNMPTSSDPITHSQNKEHSSTSAESIDPRILAPSSERSSPRAPARYMSRAVSINSSSSSGSFSESESENYSGSAHTQANKTPVKTETVSKLAVADTDENVEEVQPESISLGGRLSGSQASGPLSDSSQNSEVLKSIESRRAELAAEEQLQREYRQSTQPSRVLSQAPKSVTSQNAAASTAASSRAASYPWSRMTDLMNRQSDSHVQPFSKRSSYNSSSNRTVSKGKPLARFSISGSSSSDSSSSDGEKA